MHTPRPYHATAADRIADAQAQMASEGRICGIADRLDPLALALWHKRDRWTAERFLEAIGYEDDRPGFHSAAQVRREAGEAHRNIIERLWATRFADRAQARMLRLADDCANTTAAAVSDMRALFSDAATAEATGRL